MDAKAGEDRRRRDLARRGPGRGPRDHVVDGRERDLRARMADDKAARREIEPRLAHRDGLLVAALARRLDAEPRKLGGDIVHREPVPARAGPAALHQIVGEKRDVRANPPLSGGEHRIGSRIGGKRSGRDEG